MDGFLERFQDHDVEVLYRNDSGMYTDKGRLVDASTTWIELSKDAKGKAETLLIPISAIRIVKVTSAPVGPSARLLRPAEKPNDLDLENRS